MLDAPIYSNILLILIKKSLMEFIPRFSLMISALEEQQQTLLEEAEELRNREQWYRED